MPCRCPCSVESCKVESIVFTLVGLHTRAAATTAAVYKPVLYLPNYSSLNSADHAFLLSKPKLGTPAICTRTNATCERVYQVKHSMQKQCFLATTTELKSNEKKRQNTYRLLFTSAVRMLLLTSVTESGK